MTCFISAVFGASPVRRRPVFGNLRQASAALAILMTMAASAAGAQNLNAFEPDGELGLASSLPLNGSSQTRYFHLTTDQDWIRVEIAAGQSAAVTFSRPGGAGSGSVNRWRVFRRNALGVNQETPRTFGSTTTPSTVFNLSNTGGAMETHFFMLQPAVSSFSGAATAYAASATTGGGGSTCLAQAGGNQALEPNNSWEQVSSLTSVQPRTDAFHVANDVDWIGFWQNPNRRANITVTPATPSGTACWQVQLMRQQAGAQPIAVGAPVAMGSSAVSFNNLDTPASTTGGEGFYVEVRAANGEFSGPASTYTVSMTDGPLTSAPYEPNNEWTSPTSLPAGGTQDHFLDVDGDVDWIGTWMTPNHLATYTITPLTPNATNPWRVQVYRLPDGGPPVFDHEYLMGSAPIVATRRSGSVAEGTWIRVVAANPNSQPGFSGQASGYRISLVYQSMAAPSGSYEPNDIWSNVSSITTGQTFEHQLSIAGDADWTGAWFQPNKTVDYTITPVTGSAANPWRVQLYRQASNQDPVLIQEQLMGTSPVAFTGLQSGSAAGGIYVRVAAADGTFSGGPSAYRVSMLELSPPTSCNFSDWSAVQGTPAAVATPRYSGRCAISIDAVGSYLIDQSPSDETSYQARFYLHTGTRTGTVDVFDARSSTNSIVRVQHDGDQLLFTVRGSSATRAVPVNDGRWYLVQLNWSAGAGNGSLGIQVKGSGSPSILDPGAITGLNNSSDRIEEARLGMIAGSNTGSLLFDEFESRRYSPPVRLCPGDANGDGYLSQLDIDAIQAELQQTQVAPGQPDANENGAVTVSDISRVMFMLSNGLTCANN